MDKDIEAQSPATVKRRKNVGHNLPHNDKRHDKREKKKDLRICESERSSPQECSLFLSACRLRGAKKKSSWYPHRPGKHLKKSVKLEAVHWVCWICFQTKGSARRLLSHNTPRLWLLLQEREGCLALKRVRCCAGRCCATWWESEGAYALRDR